QVSSLDISNEIKEKSKELKEELIDDIKQEEPTIDIYCPSTGESRPIHSTNLNIGQAMDCDDTAVWEIVPTEINGNNTAQWKDCFICHNLCSKFYELPKHEGQRRAFFDRIIVEGLSRGALARLHISHSSTERFLEFHQKKFDRKKMRNTALSRIEAYKSHPYPSVRPKCTFPNRNGWLIEQKVCYLCNKMTDKFHTTPENYAERIEFLNRLMLTRQADEERVAALVNRRIRAYFCQMHLTTRPILELSQKTHRLSTEASVPFYKPTPRIFTECPIPERYHTMNTPRIFIDAPPNPNSNSTASPNPVRTERELTRPQPSLFAQIYASSRRQVKRRVCIVCNRMQNEHEMREFTKDKKKLPLWVNAV
ncbi:hypothetical protein PMAYCL1PPCAC_08319, partial [Pristionchus mayeri]